MTLTWHAELESTQDTAHALAQVGAPHGTAIAARNQRAGRGTRGRPWASGSGGLWFSVIGRPAGENHSVDALSLRVGLRLAAAIEAAVPLQAGTVGVKWPNDLVVADRKLGGVLCEARWRGDALDWVVVGVGINVANELPAELTQAACRLAESGWAGGPEGLAAPLVDAVCAALDASGPLARSELASLRDRDWLAGRRLTGRWAGTVRGITAAGHLRVERAGGEMVEITDAVTWADLAPSPTRR
jgi:BirA family biotin operon repressor/biotin-[acetyl-CoA-carboxylase] ligase